MPPTSVGEGWEEMARTLDGIARFSNTNTLTTLCKRQGKPAKKKLGQTLNKAKNANLVKATAYRI